ncbi:hypothetical protein [Wolbachia endosymbiont of Dactylopius coccus]
MASNFNDKLLFLTQVADTGSFFLDSSVTCTIVQTFVFEDSVLNVIAGFTSSTKVSSQCLTLGSSKIDCALYNIFDEIIRKLDSSVKHWNDTTCYLQIAMFVQLCVTRWNDIRKCVVNFLLK